MKIIITEEHLRKIIESLDNSEERLAPNGNYSNLSEWQWHYVRTPEFKSWFGDWENNPENSSMMIDENGEPQVFYRGIDEPTANNNLIDEFTFFTPIDEFAAYFTKGPGRIESAFLNVRNPIDTHYIPSDQEEDLLELIKDELRENDIRRGKLSKEFIASEKYVDYLDKMARQRLKMMEDKDALANWQAVETEAFSKFYDMHGYDAMFIYEEYKGGDDYTKGTSVKNVAIKDKNQIRYATSKGGKFTKKDYKNWPEGFAGSGPFQVETD